MALRNNGLQLRLRAYLILVDGTKSSAEIKSLNHGLPEVEMVLAALCDEGYLEAVGERQAAPIIKLELVRLPIQLDLIMTTQFAFMASLLGMLGSAYYFSLMKSAVPVEYQSSVATSAVYCFMASIMYAYMNYKFGIGIDTLKAGHYPTTLRYIDWIVTTQLIVLKFPQLLAGDDRGSAIASLVVIADFIIILFGFIGETAINASSGGEFNLIGFAMFGVSMLAWLFILFVLYSTVTAAAADKLDPIQQGLSKLKLFILIG